MLTGEYVVLNGAKALALPTKYGQSLSIEPIDEHKLIWNSLDENNALWFKETFDIEKIISGSSNLDSDISRTLFKILNIAKHLNPNFLNTENGFMVETKLDFPRIWGLGTSSTLINNIASWAQVDAYQLQNKSLGGSGYDIACACHDAPIIYRLNSETLNPNKDSKRFIQEVNFYPTFADSLYFVHLNKKQDTRKSIAQYYKHSKVSTNIISEINVITSKIIDCTDLQDFGMLITKHEQIISKIIKQKPIKNLLFKDFSGSIKSLGAWGGDFIIVASNENPTSYFKKKGLETIVKYNDMIL